VNGEAACIRFVVQRITGAGEGRGIAGLDAVQIRRLPWARMVLCGSKTMALGGCLAARRH